MIARRSDLNIQLLVLVLGLVIPSAAAWVQEKPTEVASPANPFQELREKTILVITPHPDDDIIGCGEALAFLSGHRNRLIVVFLTAGEKGTFDPSAQVKTIRRTRIQEAASAYKTLGFPDAELIWLK